MADPSQFVISHKELVELIIRKADVHEGRWFLLMGFGLNPGNFGPNEEQVYPGMMVTVNQIGIQREPPEGGYPSGLVVDAAEVNPSSEQPSATPVSRAKRRL
jgi:hypothetical protein